MSRSNRHERGEALRRELLGDEWVDKALARADGSPLAEDFQTIVTEHLFGEIWSRPGLAIESRLIVVITVLAMRGQQRELANYIRVALDRGMSVEALREVLLQVTAYAGFPAGQGAFSTALDVLEARGR